MEKLEITLKIKALEEELSKLRAENLKLKEIIRENDLDSEISGIDFTSPEEEICVKGIQDILEKVKSGTYTKFDISNFDILFKNLRVIRGKSAINEKNFKTSDVATLLKIVGEDK